MRGISAGFVSVSNFLPLVPATAGTREHWRRLWVPGLASLARDTKTWIPACAGMNGVLLRARSRVGRNKRSALRHSRLAEFADGAQFVGPVAENISLTDETRSKRRNGA